MSEQKAQVGQQSIPPYPPLPQEIVDSNNEAMARMDAAVPTPTQAEIDAVRAAQVPADPDAPEEPPQSERNAAAMKRMDESVPTPTQAENDAAKLMATGEQPAEKKKEEEAPAPSTSYSHSWSPGSTQ